MRSTPGLIVLFGSGEMSPTGRKIHEAIFQRLGFKPPVRVGILETPTGFEVNAIHGWPERMEKFFEKSLRNFKPAVTRIRAWRRDGLHSTNDEMTTQPILSSDYLYCGAGSPGYTIRHLRDTKAYEKLKRLQRQGGVLCLGSATAVAISRFAIPVYEIFKAGEDLHWLDGLDMLSEWLPNLAIVPHWNNREGEDFDTTRCWMGEARFDKLVSLLPPEAGILGIDEQTACVLDVTGKSVEVTGIGNAYVLRAGKRITFKSGSTFPFSFLTSPG